MFLAPRVLSLHSIQVSLFWSSTKAVIQSIPYSIRLFFKLRALIIKSSLSYHPPSSSVPRKVGAYGVFKTWILSQQFSTSNQCSHETVIHVHARMKTGLKPRKNHSRKDIKCKLEMSQSLNIPERSSFKRAFAGIEVDKDGRSSLDL